MSSPNDLENTTRLLASQQGTATISKAGRRSTESPERTRKSQKTTQGSSTSARDASAPHADVGQELKVDEEAIRQLRGLQEEADEGAQENPGLGTQQEAVMSDPSGSADGQPTPEPPSASAELLLEKDTPASAGPSRAPSPRPASRLRSDDSSSAAGDDGASLSASAFTKTDAQRSKAAATHFPVQSGQLRREGSAMTSHSRPSLLSLGSMSQRPATAVERTTVGVGTPPKEDERARQDGKTDESFDRTSDMEDNDDDDDDDESSDEETEPSLKYQRLKGTVLDVVKKDSISTLNVSEKFIALGTHAGMIFIVDFQGNLIKGFRSHTASVLDIDIDSTMEFVAAAGMDGLISINSLTSAEHYAFDFKRPMRTISLEPNFGRRATRAFVCGGMAGALIHREKGWLGHKETVLHGGEGPIWSCRWKGDLIAWANDKGVRIYDNNTRQKITFINAPQGQARGDLYRCNLIWQDERTLTIAWADQIKLAKIKEKEAKAGGIVNVGSTSHPQLQVEITKIFQLDCAISGLAPYGDDLLVLAYLTESEDGSDEEDDSDPESSRAFRRKAGQRPELRIINPITGEEKSSDVLSLSGSERLNCNDYRLIPSYEAPKKSVTRGSKEAKIDLGQSLFYVVSPREIIIARPRDHKDHINWLLDQKKFESALGHVEAMGPVDAKAQGFDAAQIGRDYLSHLTDETGDYVAAARAARKILAKDAQAWEEFVFLFLERGKLNAIIDYVPTEDPVLSSIVYDMVLAHFLQNNLSKLKGTLRRWPIGIYSTQAVALAIEDRLQSSPVAKRRSVEQELRPWTAEHEPEQTLLMELLADLYVRNHQPGKSLTYHLRLKRPEVFDLIREHNLFLDVRDQARQLIEFEEAMQRDTKEAGTEEDQKPLQAVQLLVDHVHSIPVQRVVSQLEAKSEYLHLYLDALFERDPQLVMEYSDLQIELYADYGYEKLMYYLRAMSSYYSFEKAFRVCELHDYVPEMVFLLGRVGDNKRALNLIIERLNDVSRAIDFAKEQNDDDLWEDLLRYSENRPAFIRGLLENVGAEIDPIRLIRRIKDGLEIPGLRPALIKILHDFNLQISLLEGCLSILYHDIRSLQDDLFRGQTQAHYCEPETITAGSAARGGGSPSVCDACSRPLFAKGRLGGTALEPSSSTAAAASSSTPSIVFLCRHVYHLPCLLSKAGTIPARKAKGATEGVRAVLTTATQVASRARVLSVQGETAAAGGGGSHADEALATIADGPALRAHGLAEEFREKIAYSARLRGALRSRGCPDCRAGAQSSLRAETGAVLVS